MFRSQPAATVDESEFNDYDKNIGKKIIGRWAFLIRLVIVRSILTEMHVIIKRCSPQIGFVYAII